MSPEHSDDFRKEALRIALTSGLPRRQVASDLGVGFATLNKWVKALGDGAPHHDKGLARENERLRREVRQLKEEREVLKRAIHFFAGPTD